MTNLFCIYLHCDERVLLLCRTCIPWEEARLHFYKTDGRPSGAGGSLLFFSSFIFRIYSIPSFFLPPLQ